MVEKEEFYEGGIIPGESKKEEKKEDDYLDKYMLSTVSLIKEELIMKFQKEKNGFYIYTKYSKKDRILQIYVSLTKDSKINSREMSINFLIIVNEEFPNKPPFVFCLTDVNQKIYIILILIII
jgi:uncharacterized membrane protein